MKNPANRIRIYQSIIKPMLLYGSEIYRKEVLQFKTKSSLLHTIQRIPLVNLVRAYKSVSKDKLLDVTNVWSIEDEIIFKERKTELKRMHVQDTDLKNKIDELRQSIQNKFERENSRLEY